MKLPLGFDLHAIEIFMATADLGNMTQSAARFNISQSAVSQIISKLEAALKSRVFDRTIRPLALTPSGSLLYTQGSILLSSARALAAEVANSSQTPLETITIAMAESLANLLTAPLLNQVGFRATQWKVRSGISLLQYHEFIARGIDIMLTGSSEFVTDIDLECHTILHESHVVITPASYLERTENIELLARKPFVRYSQLSSMGQRIDRQLSRMRLEPAEFVEVDSTTQQLTSVALGLGWSITTPLCLASRIDLLPALCVAPMPQAQFRRHVRLMARKGELSDLPKLLADVSRNILRNDQLAPIRAQLPWIDTAITWPDD